MTAAQLRRQLAKIKPPANAVEMLRSINEVWPNKDLAALPEGMKVQALIEYFTQDEFIKDVAVARELGRETPEASDSIFGLHVLPRSFGYFCEVSIVVDGLCGLGAEFQFGSDGALLGKRALSEWIA